jgi:hypothetical protein
MSAHVANAQVAILAPPESSASVTFQGMYDLSAPETGPAALLRPFSAHFEGRMH